MNMKTRRFAGIAASAAMTASLFSTAAFAADLSTIEDAAESLAVTSASTTTINAEVNYDGIEIAALLSLVLDPEAGAQSLDGTVDISGIQLDIAEYWDADKLMVAVPLINKVLSYNYSSVPASGYLAENIGTDYIELVNSYLQTEYSTIFGGGNLFSSYEEGIVDAFTTSLSSLSMTTVTKDDLTGMEITADGAFMADLYDNVMAVQGDDGVAFGDAIADYANSFAALAELTGSDISDITDTVDAIVNAHDTIASMPAVTLDVYVNDASMPAEISLTIEGSTLSLQFLGENETSWTDIVLAVDDEAIAELTTTISDNGADVVLSADGTEYAAFSYAMSEDSMNIELSAEGESVFAFTVNADSSYSLDIPSIGIPITGTILDNGLSFNIDDVLSGQITVDVADGGTAQMPEGDAVDLSTATEEELNEVISTVASLFGSSAE